MWKEVTKERDTDDSGNGWGKKGENEEASDSLLGLHLLAHGFGC